MSRQDEFIKEHWHKHGDWALLLSEFTKTFPGCSVSYLGFGTWTWMNQDASEGGSVRARLAVDFVA
jgi:hypothetical protein